MAPGRNLQKKLNYALNLKINLPLLGGVKLPHFLLSLLSSSDSLLVETLLMLVPFVQ